jgi:hypothetical protein
MTQQNDEKTLIIEDVGLRGGFTQIPNLVLRDGKIDPVTKMLYVFLLSYAWQSGQCFPGHIRLGEDLGITERQVSRLLNKLKARGLVGWTRRGQGQTNYYRIKSLERVYFEADRTSMSDHDVTPMSGLDRTPMSHKEYSVEEDSVKKKQVLSHNPYIAAMQSFLGFPEKTANDPVPAPAREAAAISRMLKRGFTWDDIFELWKSKVLNRKEFVSMTWVNEDIGKGAGNGANRQGNKGAGVEQLEASVGRITRPGRTAQLEASVRS